MKKDLSKIVVVRVLKFSSRVNVLKRKKNLSKIVIDDALIISRNVRPKGSRPQPILILQPVKL